MNDDKCCWHCSFIRQTEFRGYTVCNNSDAYEYGKEIIYTHCCSNFRRTQPAKKQSQVTNLAGGVSNG